MMRAFAEKFKKCQTNIKISVTKKRKGNKRTYSNISYKTQTNFTHIVSRFMMWFKTNHILSNGRMENSWKMFMAVVVMIQFHFYCSIKKMFLNNSKILVPPASNVLIGGQSPFDPIQILKL